MCVFYFHFYVSSICPDSAWLFFIMFCQIFCIFIVDDVRCRSGRMNWKINFQKQKLTRFGWLREICRGFKYKSFYSCREQSQRYSFFLDFSAFFMDLCDCIDYCRQEFNGSKMNCFCMFHELRLNLSNAGQFVTFALIGFYFWSIVCFQHILHELFEYKFEPKLKRKLN